MTPCAPFAVTRHNGTDWITRGGARQRPAPPEVVYLWQRRPEALVMLCELGNLTIWGFEGNGWQNDPALLRQAAEALLARARTLEKDGD